MKTVDPEIQKWAKRLEIEGLANGMGYVFEEAAGVYDLQEFAYAALQSIVFTTYFFNYTIHSQSAGYILEEFELDEGFKEMSPAVKTPETDIMPCYDKAAGFWMGYLLAKWYQENKVDPKAIDKDVIRWLYEGYDILHTQDIQYCYQLYQEYLEEERESMIKEE